jgi:hypothetical protein
MAEIIGMHPKPIAVIRTTFIPHFCKYANVTTDASLDLRMGSNEDASRKIE